MQKLFFILLALLFAGYSQFSCAAVRGSNEAVLIDSKILGETRELLIHLPNNYRLYENKQYPVLFLLDGQRNLNHVAGTLDLLNQSNMAQEMIIIAIMNTHRTRDFTPTRNPDYDEWGISGGADDFLSFIGQELIPHVDENFRTNGLRILSGHSLGGLLTVYALHTRPALFQAYFAFSPSLWWHDEVIFKQARDFYQNTPELNKYLYVNLGNEDGQMQSAFERFTSLLGERVPDGFVYNMDLDTSETHNTIALAGHALALKHFNNLLLPARDVLEKGEKAVLQFYADQSERYSFNAKPVYKAINYLAYKALGEKDFKNAITLFKKNVRTFPEMADAYDSLADGYQANGELDKALKMRTLAVEKSISENVEAGAYKTRKANLLKLMRDGKTDSQGR